jgi:hypothetical protein
MPAQGIQVIRRRGGSRPALPRHPWIPASAEMTEAAVDFQSKFFKSLGFEPRVVNSSQGYAAALTTLEPKQDRFYYTLRFDDRFRGGEFL